MVYLIQSQFWGNLRSKSVVTFFWGKKGKYPESGPGLMYYGFIIILKTFMLNPKPHFWRMNMVSYIMRVNSPSLRTDFLMGCL